MNAEEIKELIMELPAVGISGSEDECRSGFRYLSAILPRSGGIAWAT